MEKYSRLKSRTSNNLRLKASSLYFLNDISNIDSNDTSSTSSSWRDDYTFNPMIIGRGHFSKVYKVKCCSTGNTSAVKVIRRRRLGTDKIDEIMQEIEIMQLLNKSSNGAFIQLIKVHSCPTEVAIVMEFASGGSLYRVINDSGSGLPEDYVRIILSKILSALSFLHSQEIVHLDIKADNVLLRYPYPSTDAVLTDFGLARRLTKTKVHKEMIGTPDYIAPEVANYEQISFKSDMWSVGVLVYFMLTNVSPFTGESKEDTLHRVTKTEFEYVGHLEEENMDLARDFIRSLLVKIPEGRLSADECLQHDFLSNVPIVECSLDKSSVSEAPVIDMDYKVKVRDNTAFLTRRLVMSQYDIAHHKCNLVSSEDNLLQVGSADCLDVAESSLNIDLDREIPIDGVVSTHSIDHTIECDLTEERACIDHGDDESGVIDQFGKDIIESTVNIDYEDESTHNTEFYFKENADHSSSEMTTSGFEPTTSSSFKGDLENCTDPLTSESYSILMKDDGCKENNQPKDDIGSDEDFKENHNFNKTVIYESRRRIVSRSKSKIVLEKRATINPSFRNSRENIIDADRPNEMSQSFTLNTNVYNTDTLKSVNGAVRRRQLSRSIKRDSDKPNATFDKWKRKSDIITKSEFEPEFENNHIVSASGHFIAESDGEPKNQAIPKNKNNKNTWKLKCVVS